VRRFAIALNFIAALMAAALSGCSSSGTTVAPVSAAIRQQLIVEQPPVDVSSLKATYERFQATPAVTEHQTPEQTPEQATASDQVVTVAGRIYALGMSPFDATESVFTIMELPKPGHNHEDPGDCPFCLRELKNAKMAIVRVVDTSGKTYPQPADKLLGLTKNQDIVVQGKASQIGDTLVIELQSLYLLPEAASAELSTTFHSS
jgi:hypothetical protein